MNLEMIMLNLSNIFRDIKYQNSICCFLQVEQLHKIFKLCGSPSEDYWIKTKLPRSSVIKTQRPYRRCVDETFKDFPAPAVGLMENLLSMDPAHRGTAASALSTEVCRLCII